MHLIADGIATKGLDSGACVAAFIKNVASILPGVQIRFGPHIEKFGNGTSYGPGITGIAIISESHIVVHTAPERNLIQIDVFSCREFDDHAVERLAERDFGVRSWTMQRVIDR